MVSLTYDMNGSDESIMRSIDKLQGLNDVLLIGGDLSYNVYNEVNGNFNNFLNIQEGFTDVEITINTPNGSETKTVSFDNYKSLDSTVFTDNCKR